MAWNHSIQYFPWALRTVRSALGARISTARAIDVGTGDGDFAAALARLVGGEVLGIDAEPEQTRIASERHSGVERLRYETAELLSTPVPERGFDAVVCIATIHHLDLRAGLERLRELTAPGGVLVVVGLGRATTSGERLMSAFAVAVSGVKRRMLGWYDHGAPMQGPKDPYQVIRAVAAEVLPGAEYRLRLYWRYSLVWRKPA